jgi:serine/threonine-protein phosphatase 5
LTLDEIKNIDRFHDPSSDSSLMHDLCWADPKETPGVGPNHRGTSIAFGPDITSNFLETNKLCNFYLLSCIVW